MFTKLIGRMENPIYCNSPKIKKLQIPIEITSRISDLSKPLIACQDHSSKHLSLKCIYHISHKIVKKANPSQRVYIYDIRKHRVLEIMLSFDQLQVSKVWIIKRQRH